MTVWWSALSVSIVLLSGVTSLWAATDGWEVWTAETARRRSVIANPSPLPNVLLRDENNRLRSLTGFEQPIVLLDFIYTQCPTVCIAMGAEFRMLQTELMGRGWDKQVQLLSITFDPANDGPRELAEYLARFSAETRLWSAVRFEDDQTLASVLKQLEVIVIPEPSLGYVHNSATYLVKDGHVVEIFDIGSHELVLQAIADQLGSD